MAHIDATTSKQVQDFLNSNGGIAVIDCHATWCPPCVAIGPYVVQKNSSTGIPLIKIDVDQSTELSGAYNITAMPTFLVIKGQWDNIILTVVGGGQGNVNKVYDFASQNK
jgi:thioredoxin 1